MFEDIRKELVQFTDLQLELKTYGAADTEPDHIFQSCLIQALTGDQVKIPVSAEGWQLFKYAGVCNAAKKLADKTRKICALIQTKKIRDIPNLRTYLYEYCWRITKSEQESPRL